MTASDHNPSAAAAPADAREPAGLPLPLRVVLVRTTHPGNIGAAARAMKTMGLLELVLVAPRGFPSAEAVARASGAEDVLAAARVCETLDEALAGCAYVAGLSARPRALAWPLHDVRAAAPVLLAEAARAPVALLFGTERSGLSNEELDRCQLLVNIRANADYASLNLAMAVQVVAHELRMAWLAGDAAAAALAPRGAEDPPARAEDLQRFYEHLETVLVRAEFLDPENPRHLMRRLRRLYARARPDARELNILRGMLTALDPDGDNRARLARRRTTQGERDD